jgi:two-component system, chemotaxis family, protein-glutamate methylesterase/glutaminase
VTAKPSGGLITALVVDDSAFNRVTLARLLESSGEVEVVATAVNGEDAIKQALRHRPQVITLDLEMPVMDGFAFLRWLMANMPTPVIAVSSRSSDRSVFKALEFGAVDFIAKPGGRVSARLTEIEADLHRKVRQVVEVKLENVRPRIAAEDDETAVPTGKISIGSPLAVDLVVIGSSTGGPPALQLLFKALPLMPLPFVIAQHMPPTFTRFFAERLNRLTAYRVKEAQGGELLAPGTVYVAPGGEQTEIMRDYEGLRIRVSPREPDQIHAPSVNLLFESASNLCGARLLAAVLTGMGDDGARGVRKIRENGGRTIAESAQTAIIFGMPAEAIRTGAVQEVLPLHQIAPAIQRLATTT